MKTLRSRCWISLILLTCVLPPLEAQRMVNFGEARGYLATPRARGRHPGVIVIQEWWGLNGWIKRQADRLAAHGYVALAPDLYHGKLATTPQQAMALMRGFDRARGMRDLQAAYAYLRRRPGVKPRRIATLGWCFGGGLALRFAARQPGLRGAVVYYGYPLPSHARAYAGNMRVPLLGNFGGADPSIPAGAVRRLAARLRANGQHPAFKIYPGMPHAFAHLKTRAGRAATRDAWRRTLAFLHRRLKGKKT